MSENQTTKFADKNLLDEEFLSAVLCDNAACQYVLRILLGVNDIVVKSVSDRVAVKNPQAPGEVVDVSGEDSRGFTWEIAVCRTDRVEPLHSRCEFARIVKRLEDNGEGYSDTREMAVVYIGAVDHYGKSQNIYTVRSYIKEMDKPVDDGTRIIFANGRGRKMVSQLCATAPAAESWVPFMITWAGMRNTSIGLSEAPVAAEMTQC